MIYIVKKTFFGYAVINSITGLLQSMHGDYIEAKRIARDLSRGTIANGKRVVRLG